MAKEKIKLELTELEMSSIIDILYTIEGMYGTSDTETSDDLIDWDTCMKKDIRRIDKMLKRNGYKR